VKDGKKVLFIGHEASRTGAPLLMLELMKWLAANSTVNPSVLLKRGGEIESDYRAIAPTKCYADERHKLNRGLHRSLLRKLQLSTIREPGLAKLFPPQQYPVVYANTVDTCDLAMELVGSGRRLIHHIHELSYTSECLGATKIIQKAVPRTDFYIADSYAVHDFLVTRIHVPTSKIQVIHPFPVADCQNATKDALRRQLGIADDAFVIGMCGLPQWRKGTDLFVQLAMFVKRLGLPRCHFVWLGGDSVTHREALHDVTQLGLQNICHFLTAVLNPEAYFRGFDLFALTSREDPFPVAMLEAAAAGSPIVCFAGAGGAPEFVESDAGIVVPYLDIAAMAKACIELLVDDKRRRKLAENARMKVQLRNTLTTQGPKFLAVLRTAAEGGSQAGSLKG
jgi:glycosyltransferase involved in cell wall biosynthesis